MLTISLGIKIKSKTASGLVIPIAQVLVRQFFYKKVLYCVEFFIVKFKTLAPINCQQQYINIIYCTLIVRIFFSVLHNN